MLQAEVSFILAPSSVADLVALLPFYVAKLDIMETPCSLGKAKGSQRHSGAEDCSSSCPLVKVEVVLRNAGFTNTAVLKSFKAWDGQPRPRLLAMSRKGGLGPLVLGHGRWSD